jgi:hypothetical protein
VAGALVPAPARPAKSAQRCAVCLTAGLWGCLTGSFCRACSSAAQPVSVNKPLCGFALRVVMVVVVLSRVWSAAVHRFHA